MCWFKITATKLLTTIVSPKLSAYPICMPLYFNRLNAYTLNIPKNNV